MNYFRGTVTHATVEKNCGGTVGKKCWLDRNLGAIRGATSVTDYKAYGDLFQWGRGDDGHQVMTWTNASTGTGTTVVTGPNSNDNPGIPNWIHISNNSPYDWRIPQNNSLWQGVNGKTILVQPAGGCRKKLNGLRSGLVGALVMRQVHSLLC